MKAFQGGASINLIFGLLLHREGFSGQLLKTKGEIGKVEMLKSEREVTAEYSKYAEGEKEKLDENKS